jgi:hypothetical protein
MSGRMIATLCLLFGWGSMSLVLCAVLSRQPSPTLTFVPIPDFHSVAGTWAGVATRVPPSPRDDWVELTIHDDGTYETTGARTTGVLLHLGMLTLSDGRIISSTDRESATYLLYEGVDRRVLWLEAAMKDGIRYSAELTLVK